MTIPDAKVCDVLTAVSDAVSTSSVIDEINDIVRATLITFIGY